MGRMSSRAFPMAPPVQVRSWELVVLAVLVVAGVQSMFHFADYWFFGGHRKTWFLFVPLSFAVFWGPFRNLVNWAVYLCARTPQSVESEPALATASVDVVTTAMPGEPFAMFEETLAAIVAMKHPHRTFLLDGGDDPALKALCERLGAQHVDCRGIPGAKAGKVNHALKTRCTGEFVLVIDPDHVPQADFLDRTLVPLTDSGIGFVQVVQAYHNGKDNWVAGGAAEQTYGFYGPTLIGLNGLGIPTAIGANCLFRRAALDSIGGHAVHLAEDALTSMRLHSAGWRSVYLPWRGSHGLAPAELGAFFKQQIKWATGMFNLLIHEMPKLWKGFPLAAKLHYPLAATFYLNGLATGLTILLPIPFLLFQAYAVEMPLRGFLAHVLPYAVSIFLIHAWVQRWYSHREEVGFPWRSMFLEKGTWHVYALGLYNSLRGREVPYLPTPKTRGSGTALSWVWPHWVAIGTSLVAVAWALLTYHRLDEGALLMVVFALTNVVLLLPSAWTGTFGSREAQR